jgi:hypothetical protein
MNAEELKEAQEALYQKIKTLHIQEGREWTSYSDFEDLGYDYFDVIKAFDVIIQKGLVKARLFLECEDESHAKAVGYEKGQDLDQIIQTYGCSHLKSGEVSLFEPLHEDDYDHIFQWQFMYDGPVPSFAHDRTEMRKEIRNAFLTKGLKTFWASQFEDVVSSAKDRAQDVLTAMTQSGCLVGEAQIFSREDDLLLTSFTFGDAHEFETHRNRLLTSLGRPDDYYLTLTFTISDLWEKEMQAS